MQACKPSAQHALLLATACIAAQQHLTRGDSLRVLANTRTQGATSGICDASFATVVYLHNSATNGWFVSQQSLSTSLFGDARLLSSMRPIWVPCQPAKLYRSMTSCDEMMLDQPQTNFGLRPVFSSNCLLATPQGLSARTCVIVLG